MTRNWRRSSQLHSRNVASRIGESRISFFEEQKTNRSSDQGPKSLPDLPTWLTPGPTPENGYNEYDVPNIAACTYRLFAASNAADDVQQLFPKGVSRDCLLSALDGNIHSALEQTSTWESPLVTPFAVRGEMENIRRTLQIFTRLSQKYVNDNEDAIEDRSCYLYAIEALLDFGHLEQAKTLSTQLRPGDSAAGPMSNLAPFKYPFNLIEDTIYCRGMVLSEYLLHALGRMTQETKARRMNEGRVSIEYVLGLLADID